jgi:hypothetical protein
MPQARASTHRVRDYAWDQSRDWGFDDGVSRRVDSLPRRREALPRRLEEVSARRPEGLRRGPDPLPRRLEGVPRRSDESLPGRLGGLPRGPDEASRRADRPWGGQVHSRSGRRRADRPWVDDRLADAGQADRVHSGPVRSGAIDTRRPHALEERIEEAGARLLSARVENAGLRPARRRRTDKVRADLDAAFRGAGLESGEDDDAWGGADLDGRDRLRAAIDDLPAFASAHFDSLRGAGAGHRNDGWPGVPEAEWRRHEDTEPVGPSPLFNEAGDYIGGEPEGRRTITIRGRGSSDLTSAGGRRAAQRPHERAGFKPDRIAMWAVMLGIVLVLVAATSSHAAALPIQHLLRPR